jgi:hypothetical protein
MNKWIFLKITITLLAVLMLLGLSQPVSADRMDMPEDRSWSNFQYVFVAGTTLMPRSSATTWTYAGGGCVYASAGTDIFNIHLNLPQGSRIDYLRMYYYDASTADSTAWVTTYNGGGGFTDLISVSSSLTSGYGYVVSGYIGHIVDNSKNAYVLNFWPNQTGSTMRLCGLRVAYRVPVPDIYLPLILK